MKEVRRSYGLLLAAYPKSYRNERGAEIVATLLENALTEKKGPNIGDIADIAFHGSKMRVQLIADQMVRRARNDLGAVIATVASATLAISLFLPWYVVILGGSSRSGSVAVSAVSAGGGRFLIFGLCVATSVAAFLGPRLRALALLFSFVLLYATWICLGNSPVITTAGPSRGIFAGTGAHLGIAANYFILAGSAVHMARPGRAGFFPSSKLRADISWPMN